MPIDEQDYTSEHDEIADLIADNRISELSEMDQTMVASLMQELDKADFDLSLTAFTENELGAFLEPDKKPDLPEVAFSEQLMEANNYVVVVFRNEIDWLWAQEHFALKSVYSRRPNGKPWSCGIGRVINGADYAKRFHV